MKKNYLVFALITMVIMGIVLLANPGTAVSQKSKKQEAITKIPDEVMKIFTNSCKQCHAEGGNSMAMSMVNFSEWDTYPLKKQTKKAEAICNAITKGIMPPESVRKASPEKVPTKEQIDLVCNWASTVK